MNDKIIDDNELIHFDIVLILGKEENVTFNVESVAVVNKVVAEQLRKAKLSDEYIMYISKIKINE